MKSFFNRLSERVIDTERFGKLIIAPTLDMSRLISKFTMTGRRKEQVCLMCMRVTRDSMFMIVIMRLPHVRSMCIYDRAALIRWCFEMLLYSPVRF